MIDTPSNWEILWHQHPPSEMAVNHARASSDEHIEHCTATCLCGEVRAFIQVSWFAVKFQYHVALVVKGRTPLLRKLRCFERRPDAVWEIPFGKARLGPIRFTIKRIERFDSKSQFLGESWIDDSPKWVLLQKELIHESRIYSNPISFDALNAAQRNGETVFSEPRVADAEFPSEYL